MAVGDIIYWWMSNPLILLAAGSVSSGLLIPYFTRRWQDHQTELKLKVDLLKDLTGCVTDIIMAVRHAEELDSYMVGLLDGLYHIWQLSSKE
jgi:hypothetical protein